MAAATTLFNALAHLKGDYSALFTPKAGNLTYHESDNRWEIVRGKISSKAHEAHFTALTRAIVLQGVEGISNPRGLIQRINIVWIGKYSRTFKTDPDDDSGSIQFKSNIKGREWLSNFFPTLLLHNGQVCISSEQAYLTGQFELLQPDNGAQIHHIFDPIKMKKIVASARKEWERTEGALPPCDKAETMRPILAAKFDCNPILQACLAQTGNAILEEKGGNLYWANGNGDPGAQNMLGTLLSELRASYQEPE